MNLSRTASETERDSGWKLKIFLNACLFNTPLRWFPLKCQTDLMMGLRDKKSLMISAAVLIPYMRWKEGQTDRWTLAPCLCIASRGNNLQFSLSETLTVFSILRTQCVNWLWYSLCSIITHYYLYITFSQLFTQSDVAEPSTQIFTTTYTPRIILLW